MRPLQEKNIWANIRKGEMGQYWANVNPTLIESFYKIPLLAHHWLLVGMKIINVGRTLHQHIGPSLGRLAKLHWPNVSLPTLAQRKQFCWANVGPCYLGM